MDVKIQAEKRPPRPWDATARLQTDRGDVHLDVNLLPVDPPADWDGALAGTANGLTMTLLLRMRDGRGQSRVNWSFSAGAGTVNEQAALLSLIDAAHGAGTFSIEERLRRPGDSGGGRRFISTLQGQVPDPRIVVARKLLDDLRVIEDWTGEPYELPEDWPSQDFENVSEVAEMIRRGERRGSPTASLRVPPAQLDEMR